MRLYIIRHGESTNNRLGRQLPYEEYIQKRTYEPPLTELGHRQAHAVAEHLAKVTVAEHLNGIKASTGYGITRIYCSAMLRAMQTAQPIQQALGINPEVLIDIHEQGGLFEGHPQDPDSWQGFPGLTRTEMIERFPGYILPDEITENGWWTGTYEPWSGCVERAKRTASRLIQLAEQFAKSDVEEHVALVAHGDFIDRLLKALLRQLPGDDFYYIHYNTAITQVDFPDDGRLVLRYINRTEHFTPELFVE
ncbi:MAG: histidine phosphatase family protein [Chloroflexota bacterium]